jgi:protease I
VYGRHIQKQDHRILLTNGVEQVELTEPRKALEAAAGAQVVIVSPVKGEIQGMNHKPAVLIFSSGRR